MAGFLFYHLNFEIYVFNFWFKLKQYVNNYNMNKKEYIEKIKELIINKVKYHSPNLNNDNIDYSLLEAVGINISLPIFIFKRTLDKVFILLFCRLKSW